MAEEHIVPDESNYLDSIQLLYGMPVRKEYELLRARPFYNNKPAQAVLVRALAAVRKKHPEQLESVIVDTAGCHCC